MTGPWDYEWADWVEPAYPMTGPAFTWATVEYLTIHYPGAPRVLPLSFESERAEIRAEQRMYLRKTPPYSLGYNAKVFQDGTRWKLRGDVLRCAANGSAATNLKGFAIQIRVANDESPSQPLIDSVRSIVAWARAESGRELPINGHRDLKATACPGDQAYALIQSGVFEPLADPVVIEPLPIPPSEEDDDMPAVAAIYKPNDAVTAAKGGPYLAKWFVLKGDGGIRQAVGPDNEMGAPVKMITSAEHYDVLEAESRK